MKKIGIVWIVLVLLLTLFLASCSSAQEKTYEQEFVLLTPDTLHEILLSRVDLSYRDLDLTRDELEVIKKYSKYGNVLRAGAYEWPAKSETLAYRNTYYDLGVDIFEIEVLSKILGIHIEIEKLPLEDVLDKIATGQLDFVPGIYMEPAFAEIGSTMEMSTYIDPIYAYVASDIDIRNVQDFNGMTIGTLSGFNLFNDEMKRTLLKQDVDYVFYKNITNESIAMEYLDNGRMDIFIQTFSTELFANNYKAINISQIFNENATDFLFTNKNSDAAVLMSAIQKVYSYNKYMKLLKQDYMDMYAAMSVSLGAVFSFPERAIIYNSKKTPIKVLAIDNSPPYIDYDEMRQKWDGISFAIWDTVADTLDLQYTFTENIDEATIIIPMYISLSLKSTFNFSNPMIEDKFAVAGLHDAPTLYDIRELSNAVVGIVEGQAATKAIRSLLPQKEFDANFSSNAELIAALVNGEIEYGIISKTQFDYFFYSEHYYDLALKLKVADAKSAIAFKKTVDGRKIYSIFNKTLPFIKPEQIIEQYTSIDTDINAFMQSKNRDMLIMFVFMFLIIVAFLVFFLRRLSLTNKQVREIAFLNNITGMQNRTAFYSENTLATGSLILVSIDEFKRVNDVYGHDVGDMYAHEVAQRIVTIADEFNLQAYAMDIDSFLLLDDGGYIEDKLVSISAKILYEVTKSVRIYEVDHKLTASVGIAIKKDEKGMEELFKKADTALFLAKERGRNRYVIASDEEFVAHRRKQFLTEQLSSENIQSEITPYYQPKIDIRDGRIIGVEALARWNSKDHGIIYPTEILPVLAENGTLPILDISILTKACKDYMDWLRKNLIDRSFIISCNMSYLTIQEFDILAAVTQIHDNIGMPYRSLEIEIKEDDFTNHLDVINDKLIELSKMGVNIAMDNFRADKSIIAKVATLPVNVIKVDKALLQENVTKKLRESFELISSLSRRLNLGLIIEGVETAEQIQLLKEIPIYRVQGYYYSQTVSAAELEKDLKVRYIYR